ncbi:MAG: serine hydrolase domain-containing protein, partial [Pseudomonadota bacterium]
MVGTYGGIIRAVLLAFVALQHAHAAAAQTAPVLSLGQLDAEFERLIASSPTPGAVLAIVEDGAVVLAKGYGYADVEAKIPMTADTVLRAGSLSKNLTSLAVLRLVGEGALDLDAPLSVVAPEVQVANPWSEEFPIRLEHLLEHTAGIEGSTYYEYGSSHPGMTPRQYADMMAGKVSVDWPPGWFYSYA